MGSRSNSRGMSKSGVPPPRSIFLESGSGFFIAEDGYVVTNFPIMERAYNMKLVLEERNAYAVEFVFNVAYYIMGERVPSSSKPWSK